MTEKKDVSIKQVLPGDYIKPMVDMIERFSSSISPGEVACPAAIAIAIAIVIVLWDRPYDELIMTTKERAALKIAAEQIKAYPERIEQVTGIKLTPMHQKLIEALSQFK